VVIRRSGQCRASRRVFALFVTLLMCVGLLSPAIAAAQEGLATPIAPGDVGANNDSSLGAQSVVFARFDQSSATALAGDTVHMTLSVTSTANASTNGSIAIPAVSNLTFTLNDAQRTENMATCNAVADGSGGIAGTYSLAAGTGTCAISFAVHLSGTASGMLTVAAAVSENGSLASSPTATITVPDASMYAYFSDLVFDLPLAEGSPITLVIEMSGVVNNGVVTMHLPLHLDFANAAGVFSGSGSGTCSAEFSQDGRSINGVFSGNTPGGLSTCTITVEATSNYFATYDPITADVTADGLAAFNLSSGVDTVAPGPVLPEVIFEPGGFNLPVGVPANGLVRIGYAALSVEQEVTISSTDAVLSNPQLLHATFGATCSVSTVGDTIAISILQQDSVIGTCSVQYTVTVKQDVLPGSTVLIMATDDGDNDLAYIPVFVHAVSTGVSAAFDQASYSGVVGDLIPVAVNITIPAGKVVTGGTFQIGPPLYLVGTVSVAAASASMGPSGDGTCEVTTTTFPVSNVVNGMFSSTGGEAVNCTVNLTLSVNGTSDAQSGILRAYINGLDTDLIPLPTLIPTATLTIPANPQSLTISLDRSTAMPGDNVTVTVAQTESFSTHLPAVITGTLPDGVVFNSTVPGSTTCNPVGNCDWANPPQASPSEVSGSYMPFEDVENTTITMTYVVTVTAPVGSSIDFFGSGQWSTYNQTFAGPATLNVQGDAPETTDFTLVVEAGGSISGLLGNHLASVNGIATYASESPSGDGVFDLDAVTGAFTYTAASTPGSDSIAYSVTDAADFTQSGTIHVTIIEPLETPNVGLHALPGDTITYDLNDAIIGGQAPHTFTEATATLAQGSIAIDASGLLTYTASDTATGSDTFWYEVTDGLGMPITEVTSSAISSGNIVITITQPMVLAPVSLTVPAGGTVTFDLHSVITGGVAPYTFALLGQPTSGSASVDANGILSVTAGADANGNETLTFQVTDSYGTVAITSAATAEGTITLTYLAAAPEPTATSPAEVTPPDRGPLPPNPNAGNNQGSNGGNGDDGNGDEGNSGNGSGDVTQLPNTGIGNEPGGNGPLAIMLQVLAAALVLGVIGAKVLRIRAR